jgi:hypothetical protein
LELWQQLTTSSAGVLQSKGVKAVNSGGPRDAETSSNSLDDFVVMENKLAVDLCVLVDGLLSSLKKVTLYLSAFDN